MRTNIFRYWILLLALTGMLGCEKMDTRKPLSGGGGKPSPVKDVTVSNGKGSAILTYTVPHEPDIQYVMAEYYVNSTLKRQAKASRYNNQITVDGFNSKGEYDITLYAVNMSEVKSDPFIVKVKVDSPEFRTVFQNLSVLPDFGGVNVKFSNPAKASIAIVVITKDRNGDFFPVETYYTAIDSGRFSVRGFNTDKRLFGFYVRDQFNNYSDTLFQEITPMEETMLDKNKFRPYDLPGDMPSAYGWVISNIWNNNTNSGYHSPEPYELPGTITFDLGAKAKLSRFKLWQRSEAGLYYKWGNPKKWVMWGSNSPDPSGSYAGWTKLMECNSRKPSNSPTGTNTADDINYIKNGEEFTFPLDAPASRYIRMQFFESWSNSPRIHFMEITLWGTIQ